MSFLRFPHMRLIFLIFTILTLNNAHAQDGKPAWDNSYVYLEGNSVKGIPDKNLINTGKPILLYFHGCGGLSSESKNWGETISKLGFVVITPDSFATPNREKSCILGERKNKETRHFVKQLRQDEIKFSLNELQRMKLKNKQVFIMGHSEGANAVATYPFSNVAAIIVSGYTCWRGISANTSIPVLSVQWTNDPNFTNNHREGVCEDHFKGRNKKSKQIMLNGNGHEIFHSDTAKHEVEIFLKQFTK